MLINSKITHKENSLKRILHSHFEAGNTCKLMTVNGFENFQIQNCKNCKSDAQGANSVQKFVVSPFNNTNFARVDKTQKRRKLS